MKNTTPEKLEAFIRDASEYLRLAHRFRQNPNVTVAILRHDIEGLAEDLPCFLPRVTGYSDTQSTVATETKGTLHE